MSDIKDKVLEILMKVNNNVSEDIDADLLETGVIDSFEILTIVMEIEDAFEMEIDPEMVVADNFRSVRAIVNMIERMKQ